jgi:hypothetical protein
MVSFEKAKALKIANFPQPLPAFGQVWYDLDGQAVILSKVIIIDKSYSNVKKVVCQSKEASHLKYDYDLFLNGEVIFAPTETDILVELQKGCRRGFWWALTAPDKSDNLWVCANFERNEGKNMEYLSAHPADACADAYLLSVSSIS